MPIYAAYAAYGAVGSVRKGFGGLAGAGAADGMAAGADKPGGGTSKRQAKMEKRGGQRVAYR